MFLPILKYFCGTPEMRKTNRDSTSSLEAKLELLLLKFDFLFSPSEYLLAYQPVS